MGLLAYGRSDLLVATTAANARSLPPVVANILPLASEGVTFDELPQDVARALVAIAVIAEATENHEGVMRHMTDKADLPYFRCWRLDKWFNSPECPFDGSYLVCEAEIDDFVWRLTLQETSIVIEFSDTELSDVEGFGGDAEGDDLPEVLDEEYVLPEGVTHIQETDEYIYWSTKEKKLVRLPGAKVRAIKTDYSRQGGAALTVNQIARTYGIPRAYVLEMIRKFGWTHDSSILTAEELLEGNENEWDRRAVEAIERKALVRAEKLELREVNKKARMWDDFAVSVIDPLITAIRESTPTVHQVPKIDLSGLQILKRGKLAAVLTLFDLHYGKKGWAFELNGEGYSMSECEALVFEKVHEIIAYIVHHRLTKLFVPIGHDFFHVMSIQHRTTNDTPQDMDGTFLQMLLGGSRLFVKVIELLRQVCEVHIIWVPGNHDHESSMSAALYAAATYEDATDVHVHLNPGVRAYIQWEKNLMGHIHGDGFKKPDLPRIMAQEVRKAWGETHNAMWFVGHLHHEQLTDIFGTQVFQAAALAGTDRWHFKKGFVGARRSLDAYIIHETSGKIHHDSAPVKEQGPTLLIQV
jgi:hypothetical protein